MTTAVPSTDLSAAGGLLDVLSNPAVATPSGFALAVLLYLGKIYMESRKEGRADRGDRRSDESHIVEETKDLLLTRKQEAVDLRTQSREDRRYILELEAENRRLRMAGDPTALRQEIEELRGILADRIGSRYGGERDQDRRVESEDGSARRLRRDPARLPDAVGEGARPDISPPPSRRRHGSD